MKNKLLVFIIPLLTTCLTTEGAFPQQVREALQASADDVQASLQQAGVLTREPISVLPIANDQDAYLEGLLKNAVTGAGLNYVEGRNDPVWNEIMSEVEWDERKADMLDDATLSTFGRLQSTQLLLYGVIRQATSSNRMTYVEIELHLTSIATKQHLWGDLFTRRFYPAETVQGITNINPEIRRILQNAIDGEQSNINNSPKLKAINRVAMIPLAGDQDSYITGLVENLISSTHLNPVRTGAMTLGQLRQNLRDEAGVADALLYGAVRDLSRQLKEKTPNKVVYEIDAEVQLRIEEARTGAILWSRTVSATGFETETIGWWTVFSQYSKWILIIIAAIIILIVLKMFLSAVTRSR